MVNLSGINIAVVCELDNAFESGMLSNRIETSIPKEHESEFPEASHHGLTTESEHGLRVPTRNNMNLMTEERIPLGASGSRCFTAMVINSNMYYSALHMMSNLDQIFGKRTL